MQSVASVSSEVGVGLTSRRGSLLPTTSTAAALSAATLKHSRLPSTVEEVSLPSIGPKAGSSTLGPRDRDGGTPLGGTGSRLGTGRVSGQGPLLPMPGVMSSLGDYLVLYSETLLESSPPKSRGRSPNRDSKSAEQPRYRKPPPVVRESLVYRRKQGPRVEPSGISPRAVKHRSVPAPGAFTFELGSMGT